MLKYGFQFKKSESVPEHFMYIDHELCHKVFMNHFMKIHEDFMKRYNHELFVNNS